MKATIVSLFPQNIFEVKPGLYPGNYIIPPAPLGDISFLVINDAVYYTETKNNIKQPVVTPCNILAESIIHDFMENQVGRVIEEGIQAEPGLFWVDGEYQTKDIIKKTFPTQIKEADDRQNLWFAELVKIADDSFARTEMHRSVSALQRYAAIRLGMQRPWTIMADSSDKCPFCKSQLPYGAVKCPNCKEVVDAVKYKQMTASLQEMKG